MSDEDLRRLERALVADPSDVVALERLAAALSRAGRGWHGEPLPANLVLSPKERNVYLYYRDILCLEMTYIPGDKGTSVWTTINPDGTRRAHSAFYIGRHPVTRGEWMASGLSCQLGRETDDDHAYWSRELKDHPVTRITYKDAQKFCDKIDLRLPTTKEWIRAAYGNSLTECAECQSKGWYEERRLQDDLPTQECCQTCLGAGVIAPAMPWHVWGAAPPTSEHSVAAFMASRPLAERTTDAVRDTEGRPRRLKGASPYGACDMEGHIYECSEGNDAIGTGSFRRMPTIAEPQDIGFRVALTGKHSSTP